jgi:DNA-binding SARP family transcriptional activator
MATSDQAKSLEGTTLTPNSPRGRIDILSSKVDITSRFPLTKLEGKVLFFLASRRAATREEIAEALFSHLEPALAVNSLRVTICRARRKCGEPEIITSRDGWYALNESPLDDLRAIESNVHRNLQGRSAIDDVRRATFKDYWSRLAARRPETWHLEHWFEPIDWRLQQLARDVCFILAADALVRGYPSEALSILAEGELDPLDERRREIAIRAHHALGNRTAAIAEFTRYERALAVELGITPGPSLRNLALWGRPA